VLKQLLEDLIQRPKFYSWEIIYFVLNLFVMVFNVPYRSTPFPFDFLPDHKEQYFYYKTRKNQESVCNDKC